jgi:hypothetical protein
MGKRYHYIVVYNEDDGNFYMDYGSEVYGSDGHSVYDTNTNTWVSSVDNAATRFIDTHLQNVMQVTLDKINDREAL